MRELENVIEQALVFAEGEVIDVGALPAIVRGGLPDNALALPPSEMSLPEILEDLERQLIQRAYDKSGGVKTETARLLGIKTSALYYKLEKYGIGVIESREREGGGRGGRSRRRRCSTTARRARAAALGAIVRAEPTRRPRGGPPSCSRRPRSRGDRRRARLRQRGERAPRGAARSAQVQEGRASYYGKEFDGRRTASGERYDPNGMTAAHKTLPFGTRSASRARAARRSCCASTTAAAAPRPHHRRVARPRRELDMIRVGVVPVRLEVDPLTSGYRRLPPLTFRIGPVIANPIASLSTAPSISTRAPSDFDRARRALEHVGRAVLGLELPVPAFEIVPSNRSAKLSHTGSIAIARRGKPDLSATPTSRLLARARSGSARTRSARRGAAPRRLDSSASAATAGRGSRPASRPPAGAPRTPRA